MTIDGRSSPKCCTVGLTPTAKESCPCPNRRAEPPTVAAATRATALGWALGVGRAGAIVGPLFGGWVLASGFGFEWNFYGFAVPALAGALLIGLVPRSRATLDPALTAQKEATA